MHRPHQRGNWTYSFQVPSSIFFTHVYIYEPERVQGSTVKSGVQTAVSETSAHMGMKYKIGFFFSLYSHDTVILLLWSIITTS